MEVQFKICGLTRAEDSAAAEIAGATYGGVILAPGGKRSVTIEQASRVLAGRTLRRCGVFVDATEDAIRRSAAELELSVVQLHGDESPEIACSVRDSGIEVWKAIRPRDAEEFTVAASRYQTSVDGILLDGWSPLGPGGTGTRFPWEEIAGVRSSLDPDLKLIVAGGLNGRNVADAISLLGPDVVDVSSGVETSAGIKDAELIHAFAAAVGEAVVRGETNR